MLCIPYVQISKHKGERDYKGVCIRYIATNLYCLSRIASGSFVVYPVYVSSFIL